MLERLTYGSHAAMLNHEEGWGTLERPAPAQDLHLDGPVSLHHADWTAAIRDLRQRGWEPVDDGEGLPHVLAEGPDGSELVELEQIAATGGTGI